MKFKALRTQRLSLPPENDAHQHAPISRERRVLSINPRKHRVPCVVPSGADITRGCPPGQRCMLCVPEAAR
jgi:hypothetical protein